MRKVLITLGVMIGLAVVGLIAVFSMDWNRFGKENMYVEIVDDGRMEEERSSSGEVFKRYWYELEAINEEGNTTSVTFSSHKNLRVGAYLKLYVKNDDEVTSYDEVQEEDIPSHILEKLK